MSRIALGISLAIAAIALAIFGIAGYFMPVSGTWAVTDRAHMVLHSFDGRVRVFWITSNHDRISVRSHPASRTELMIHRLPPGPASIVRSADRAIEGDSARPIWGIRIGTRGAVGSFGGQWRSGPVNPPAQAGSLEISFVRMPVWLPVTLLLIQPLRAIFFGPWQWRRRERRNLCLTCGYERIGLPEPRCPECGTPHGLAQ